MQKRMSFIVVRNKNIDKYINMIYSIKAALYPCSLYTGEKMNTKEKQIPLPDAKKSLNLVYNLMRMLEREEISENELERFLKRQHPFKLKRDSKIVTRLIVDRTIRPTYPEWVKTVMHPELELSGYVYEYEGFYEDDCPDLLYIHLWLHEDQIDRKKSVTGNTIYAYLKNNDMLKTCMSLRDAEEIYELGHKAFRKFFKVDTTLIFWKSVVQDVDGNLYVPFIKNEGTSCIFDWSSLEEEFNDSDFAARFLWSDGLQF